MRISWRHANNILLALIIVINAYVAIAPFVPAMEFWWQSHHTHQQQALTTQIHQKQAAPTSTPKKPQPNHVVIPSMLLDSPILEGTVATQYQVLNKGILRWPRGSTPDKGGNTILVGHRFTYTNPRGIFYYLNKVKVGDEIGVWWNDKRYIYKVSQVKVVPPTATYIENPTKDARLTLFTCTPLWLPKNRLVVIAELETNP